jgi:hypothetical protein
VRWTSAFAVIVLCMAGESLPPDVLLLARIKTKAAENLRSLPNYTCTETIERFKRGPNAKKDELVDRVRLEVALVDGKELFSWAGAGKFEEKGIAEIVGGGSAIGNGAFALHAKHVFLSPLPTFTYVGETALNGRPAIRYDYRVSQMVSTNRIRAGSNSSIVGYHGSFWVEKDTLDLIRLEVHSDIPPSLDLSASSDVMEYHRECIGGAGFLLPQWSELLMIDREGNQSRNLTRLSECRQYAGESVLRFGDPIPDAASPSARAKLIQLPAGLKVELRLETPIHSASSATGDPVKAVVSRNVTRNGKTLIPKGAVLTGRITLLRKRADRYVVGLDFAAIEFDNGRGQFRASLKDPGHGSQRSLSAAPETGGLFAVRGANFSFRQGHSIVWSTVD